MNRKIVRLAIAALLLLAYNIKTSQARAQTKTKEKQGSGFIIAPERFTPKRVSSQSALGKKLFEKNNCAACHSIAGQGGCLAPPLDGVAARRSKTFILARITNDSFSMQQFQKLHGPELMPHVRVSAKDAGLIASYLLTLGEPKHGYRVLPHSPPPTKEQEIKTSTQPSQVSDAAQGKTLFFDRGCIACHSLGDVGGHFAPRLDAINKRRTRDFVIERINTAEFLTQTNDEYQGRGNVMPPSNLNEKEIKAITDFLMSL